MASKNFHCSPILALLLLACVGALGQERQLSVSTPSPGTNRLAPSTSASAYLEVVGKGRDFLANLMNAELDLLPEYRGAEVYWLFHDNYLAAKVLAVSHPVLAQRIQAALKREGIPKSGKIEILFSEAQNPLSFHHYQLREVRQAGSRKIRTEVVTDQVLVGWEQYADLLLFAAIAEERKPAAAEHWKAALRLWDGKGFLDPATRQLGRYATYKLALALIATDRLSATADLPRGLREQLLALQADSGGWITDYNASGERIGQANVETTCLAILGLEAVNRRAMPAVAPVAPPQRTCRRSATTAWCSKRRN